MKKTDRKISKTGIGAAAFAMLAAGVFSANANAAPPSHAGPRASIGVTSVCALDQLPEGGGPALRVDTTIIDKTSGDEIPMISSATITPLQKVKKKTYPLGEEQKLGVEPAADFPVTHTALIEICAQDPKLKPDATSLNALVEVEIIGGSKEVYTSQCSDDPTTEAIEGGVKIGGLALCQ